MKTKISIFTFFVTLFAFLAFTACDEQNNNDPVKTTEEVAKDIGVSEQVSNDLFSNSIEGLKLAQDSTAGLKGFNSLLSNCAIVSIVPFDPITFPKTITIDFGTAGCIGNDGRVRKGKIIITASAWYVDSNAIINIQPNNFKVDDNAISGTKTITNLGRNASNNMNFNIVSNLASTSAQGTISQQSNRNIEWFAGESTPSSDDDEFKITGTTTGTAANQTNYSLNILIPLHVKNSCKWIVAGKIEITAGTLSYTLDYGNGTCDNLAVLNFQGNNINITLN